VRRWSHSYRFWQLGLARHARVPGCERYVLFPKGYRHARKLFAMIKQAELFLGVNSGPMHIARSFNIPSMILTQQGEIETIFRLRREAPYFLYQNWRHSFLYEENAHLDVAPLSEDQLLARLDAYLESHHPSAQAAR
jgi:hypothetical protein